MKDPAPSETPPAVNKPVMHLRKAGSASIRPADSVPEPPPLLAQLLEPPAQDPKKHKRASLGLVGFTKPAAWLLFLILGGCMAAIRYRGLLDLHHEFTTFGPLLMLVLYFVIVALAFQDDLFAGVLCILIPGYGFYYLVAQAGRPFFTALVFGLLAGLGEDSFVALHEWLLKFYDIITHLLAGTPRR